MNVPKFIIETSDGKKWFVDTSDMDVFSITILYIKPKTLQDPLVQAAPTTIEIGGYAEQPKNIYRKLFQYTETTVAPEFGLSVKLTETIQECSAQEPEIILEHKKTGKRRKSNR